MAQFRWSVPAWEFSDDVIGNLPDRQILVAGDNIVGRTLVLLLRHVGFDPLLVPANEASDPSQTVYLWPTVVRTLEHIGVDLSECEYATPIDSVSVRNALCEGEETMTSRSDGSADFLPTVVPTTELYRDLKKQFTNHRSLDRRIETLSYRDDALLVEFVDGIREWFDVLIYTDNPMTSPWSRDLESKDRSQLAQYEVRIEDETQVSAAAGLVDIWYPDGQIQYVSQNKLNDLLRITTPHQTTPEALVQAFDNHLLSDEPDKTVTDVCEAEPTTVRQVIVDDQAIDPSWWRDRQVCYCGRAACVMAPATGFGTSFGIEDATALTMELTQEDRPVAEATTTYANHRAQRLQALLQTINSVPSQQDYVTSTTSELPLETIHRFRSVSLAPLFGGKLQSVLRNGSAV